MGSMDRDTKGLIRAAYVHAGMNRSQFQRAIGVAYSTILNWEHGRTRPNADHLERVSEVTGVSVGELLMGGATGDAGDEAATSPALRELLASPMGRHLTGPERKTLENITFYGIEPTLATFHAILVGLRLANRAGGKRRRAVKLRPRART